MTNLMQDGATWLGERLQDSAGRAVTYTRGQQSVSITVTPSEHLYEVTDQDGFATEVLSYDWTITASDLVLNSETIQPAAGDKITLGSDVFVVTTMGSQPCFERLDANAILYLVHSKRVRDG